MLAATEGHWHMSIQVDLAGRSARALLDSGVTGIFMKKEYAANVRTWNKGKKEVYQLQGLGETSLGRVDTETDPMIMKIGDHEETVQFDVTETGEYNIILGYPWLWRHNPEINWREGTIRLTKCGCTSHTEAQESSNHSMKGIRSKAMKKEIRATGQIRNSKGWKLITPHNRESRRIRVTIADEFQEFTDMFREALARDSLPEHKEWDHKILLEEGQKPTFALIYRMMEKELEELWKYIDKNQEKGFIRLSTSPAGYPVIFVPKKDGSLRLCVDYRQLNKITVKNRYPLLLIEEIQDRFAGAKWFTALDLQGAYTHIRIKPGEEWKTAFRTRFGLYEYQVMPFGLTNAPATFQAMINSVLYEYLDKFVVVYLDDILVYTNGSREEHTEHVKKVLRKLRDNQLQLKPEKCEFFKKEVEFLGHIISMEGIRMDLKKIEAITEWPQPKNVTEVQAFHGLANYYRMFIRNFSEITKPLTTLFKKDTPFKWTDNQQRAFERIKEEFRNGDI
ncbi:hypothetical protein I7I53_08944 [Histoplasma capsulatum var. duboisii H88]|uniref:Reverse transcriptase domain-containing protein n=1 Tax=Ajellomyces capsulatus (strain H88) TaxID=544711 RepID=A0A8A1LAM6_AJEC8|nr:hypothetical protein I7I53_08944 [Histoplasma capsulatum var. duboisii H88]